MSQKPRTGDQAKPAVAARAPAKEAAKIVPAKAEPVARSGNSGSAPVAKAAEPAPRAQPSVTSEPTGTPELVAKAEQTMTPPAPTPLNVPSAPTVAAKEATSAPAPTTTKLATAQADNVVAVTDRAVRTAAPTEPAKSILNSPLTTQGMKTMMKSTEDLVAFGQANMEAFVKSGQIWSAGVQELTKQIATSAKASFEESMSTFKAISTAKSVKEAIDLQSTFAKAALEKAMAESNKITDASIKLTEQTLAPITARVTVAVETFGKTH